MRTHLVLYGMVPGSLLLTACGPAVVQTPGPTAAPVAASYVCTEVKSASAFACCGCVSASAAGSPGNRTCVDYIAGCSSAPDCVGKKVGAPCDPAAVTPVPTSLPTLPPPVPATRTTPSSLRSTITTSAER